MKPAWILKWFKRSVSVSRWHQLREPGKKYVGDHSSAGAAREKSVTRLSVSVCLLTCCYAGLCLFWWRMLKLRLLKSLGGSDMLCLLDARPRRKVFLSVTKQQLHKEDLLVSRTLFVCQHVLVLNLGGIRPILSATGLFIAIQWNPSFKTAPPPQIRVWRS